MIQRIADTQKEVDFRTSKILGMNQSVPQEALAPGQFSYMTNVNIIAGESGASDKIVCRKGSTNLNPDSTPTKWGGAILASIVYDAGATEYLIAQIGTAFYSQNLTTPGNPTLINDFSGSAYTLGSSAEACLAMSGSKILIGHPAGNAVIELISGTFKIRNLGMAYPFISAIDVTTSGALSGGWVYAIEKVYQISAVDVLVSSPNRKMASTRILVKTGTIATKKPKLTIQATELDNDTLWTHLRLWRSKNLNQDLTDPLNPIDPQGFEDELYEVALITKAEMSAGSLTAIATSSTLPPGNAGVTAGKPASVYQITDNNLDTVLFNAIGLDRIQLSPLLACNTLCVHKERTFFSYINSTTEDPTGAKVYYSNLYGSKWSELYDPQAVFTTGADGQHTVKLMSFDNDLIIIKESSTWRLPSGDVTIPAEIVDRTIGVPFIYSAGFVPKIGICAITSDNNTFQILGPDLRWTKIIYGIDVSTPLQGYAGWGVGGSGRTAFVYVNGKLLVCETGGRVFVLHVAQKRGWTIFQYSISDIQAMHTYYGGARVVIASNNQYSQRIENDSVDTDESATTDGTTADITYTLKTSPYQADDGRGIVRPNYISIMGVLTGDTYMNAAEGRESWPAGSAVNTYFTPSRHSSQESSFGRGEYRAYVETATVRGISWTPWMGPRPFISIYGIGPATIENILCRAAVDLSRSTPFGADQFGWFLMSPPMPAWITGIMCHLTFDENSTTAKDSSGSVRHHTFTAGGGSRAYDSTYANGGQNVTGSATTYYGPATAWTGLTNFGTKPITVGAIVKFASFASNYPIAWGGDGTYFWAFFVRTTGYLEFWYKSVSVSYKFTTTYGPTADTIMAVGAILSDDTTALKFYVFGTTTTIEVAATRSALQTSDYTAIFGSPTPTLPTGHLVWPKATGRVFDYFIASTDIGKAGFSEYFENSERV